MRQPIASIARVLAAITCTFLLAACGSASSAPATVPTNPTIDFINLLAKSDTFASSQCDDGLVWYGCMFTTAKVVTGHFKSKILIDTQKLMTAANIRFGGGGDLFDSNGGAAMISDLIAQSGVDPAGAVKEAPIKWLSELKALAQTQKLSTQYVWSGKGPGLSKGFDYVGSDGKRVHVGLVCLIGLMVNYDTNCEITVQNMG